DPRRARVQGVGSAVPHVDAGRLRGRPDAGDRLHGRGDEDDRTRADAAAVDDGVPAGEAAVDDRARRHRRRVTHDRQPRGARAAEREADARLLVDLVCRLLLETKKRTRIMRTPGAGRLRARALASAARAVRAWTLP